MVGIAHSYLGERYLLGRLDRHGDLPRAFRNPVFVLRVMRLAWHITSIAWFGFAALLVLIAHPPVSAEGIGSVIGIVFLVHGAVSLVVARGRHLSWVLFLLVGALTLFAVRA